MSFSNKKFKSKEFIFHEGEHGSEAYIIEKGQIEISVNEKKHKKVISHLGKGEIFGEMAIIDGSPRSADAIALEDCELICVSKDQLIERIKKADPTISFLVTILLNRIRNNITKISKNQKIKDELINIENHNQREESAFIEKMKFENELITALNNDQFSMYLQPIIAIQDENIIGFEALIRWNSPKRGFVRPDVFMGIAEETSLIIPLGQWVLRRACREFATVKRSFPEASPMFISINVSGKQLQDKDFFKVLEETTKEYGLMPSQIKLEVTESILVEGDTVLDWLKECKDKGYTIALDDFGTGYSSLSYLSKLSFDNIKVDKSFTQSMHEDPKSYVIVKAIIEMAKGLRIPVIAEGIETKEQYVALKYLGCDYGQGFLYSKPLAVNEIIEMVKNYKKIA